MSLLITPTLLDAYDWFNKAPQSWKQKAWTDLVNKLNRTRWTPNKAIQRGNDFEKQVYRFCNKPIDSYNASDVFKETCQEFTGGDFQHKLKKIIPIEGREFLLYGKTDGFWPEIIKDLKTTGNYKGASKYLGGWQHIIYCYVANVSAFRYVIVEWDDREKDPDKLVPGEVFKINYTMESRDDNKEKIKNHIIDFMQFIDSDDELTDAYYNKFNLYG